MPSKYLLLSDNQNLENPTLSIKLLSAYSRALPSKLKKNALSSCRIEKLKAKRIKGPHVSTMRTSHRDAQKGYEIGSVRHYHIVGS